ncbi:MAG: hypothetical protein P8Z36_10470 [Gemmatimonadota bacterium]|jgi:chemotaxis protein histidine kinase CheA
MSRLFMFFREEAAEQIAGMRASLLDGDAEELYRQARVLRGSAQMARQDVVRELAATVEVMAHQLARGEIHWDETVRAELSDTTAELERRVGNAREHATRTQSEDDVEEREIVPINELLYAGDRAFERATELRTALEQHIDDPDGLDLLAELFDLIELGRA